MNSGIKNIVLSGLVLFMSIALEAGSIPIKVNGRGLFRNIVLNNSLKILSPSDEDQSVELSYHLLEDALYLLDNEMKSKGFLDPLFMINWPERESWNPEQVTWEFAKGFNVEISTAFPIEKVKITVRPRIQFFYEKLTIEGVADELTNPRKAFYNTANSIQSRSSRFYAPAQWSRGMNSVVSELEGYGYLNAEIETSDISKDIETGEVTAFVKFEPGPRFYIKSINIQIEGADVILDPSLGADMIDNVFTQDALRKVIQTVRKELIQRGYPETTINSELIEFPVSKERLELDIKLKIIPGNQITIDEIIFIGAESFKRSTLLRQVGVKQNQLLNTDELRQGQRRLNSMGMFKRTTVTYDKKENNLWDVIYTLETNPNNRIELIGGIGSYDRVRVGMLWKHSNLFGSGQSGELKLIASTKTKQFEYRHSMPQIFGENWKVYSNLEFLDREEVSFDRVEYTATLGARTLYEKHNIRFNTEFNYELIRDENVARIADTGPTHTRVSSLEFRATKNETNNLLSPTKGYRISARVEMAAPQLGGDVQYFQIEIPTSWHMEFSETTLLHLGLKSGFVFSLDPDETNIPINKRYFMGGDNSIRGYQEGEASPLNRAGDEIGAEVYFLGQVELEQRIYGSLSAIVFLDALAQTADINNFPSDEELFSVGIGVRWNTLFGPIRIEYGHNLNPRPTDPSGTLHFSLGTAF